MTRFVLLALSAAAAILVFGSSALAQPLFTEDEARPVDAVVLFDGGDLSQWTNMDGGAAPWPVQDGYMLVRGGNIRSKQEFGDCQIHIEFWLPYMPDAEGQGKANSGVYVQGRYEIQVLDSYGKVSEMGDCGGIYGVAPPMVNACRPAAQWQSFDIFFRAAAYDATGKKLGNARISVLHNGIWIHDNVEVPGTTPSGMGGAGDVGPLMLQDHGNPVRYRNIWVRQLAGDN